MAYYNHHKLKQQKLTKNKGQLECQNMTQYINKQPQIQNSQEYKKYDNLSTKIKKQKKKKSKKIDKIYKFKTNNKKK